VYDQLMEVAMTLIILAIAFWLACVVVRWFARTIGMEA